MGLGVRRAKTRHLPPSKFNHFSNRADKKVFAALTSQDKPDGSKSLLEQVKFVLGRLEGCKNRNVGGNNQPPPRDPSNEVRILTDAQRLANDARVEIEELRKTALSPADLERLNAVMKETDAAIKETRKLLDNK